MNKEDIIEAMNLIPTWTKGTTQQIEFAEELIERFCDNFAEYLVKATNNEIEEESSADMITSIFFNTIGGIEDANWWCDKKDWDCFKIAISLVDNALGLDDSSKKYVKDIIENIQKELSKQ